MYTLDTINLSNGVSALKLTDMIRQHHPELGEKLDSPQYALANELIGLKLKLDLDQREMAVRVGVDFSTYLQMESGELSIPVADYEKAVASF